MYFTDLTSRIYTYAKEINDLNNILKKTYDDIIANKISKYDATMILFKYHNAYFNIKEHSNGSGLLISPFEFYSKTVIKTSGISNSAIVDFLSLIYTDKQYINFNKYLSLNFSNQFTITTEKLYEFSTIDTDYDVKVEIPLYIEEGYNKTNEKLYQHPINSILRKVGLLEAVRAYLSLPILSIKPEGK